MKAVMEATRNELEKEYKELGTKLAGFPKGPMGLTLDSVKETAEWKTAKAKHNATFAMIRDLNGKIGKMK